MEIKGPIFFKRNRVYRIYKGGKPYQKFFGPDEEGDNMFPEEWVASKVKAINPRYFGQRDGVSVVENTEIFFDDFLVKYEKEMLNGKKYDCLVKFLDSAVRLPFQVHPTKEFSQKFFNSSYGKTEAWLVVDTRPNAKIYFGFNRPITQEELSILEEKSETEKNIMETILNGITPQIGDVFLIKAGLIHAIGAGCTIIEIQEPTDFTIQPERWCDNYHISYEEEYLGLKKEEALSCINYELYGNKAIESARIKPFVVINENGYIREQLIGYQDTPCFSEYRHTLHNSSFMMGKAPAVYIVLEGEATIVGEEYERRITKGDYFFLPYVLGNKLMVKAKETVLIECLPSKQE